MEEKDRLMNESQWCLYNSHNYTGSVNITKHILLRKQLDNELTKTETEINILFVLPYKDIRFLLALGRQLVYLPG